MKQLLAISLYPLVVGGAVVMAWQLLYRLQLPLASILAPLGLAFLVVGLMERLLPYRAAWNVPRDDVATDAAYIGVNLALRELVNAGAKLGLLALVAALGLQAPGGRYWPVDWHPLAQLALALLVFDFFEYWFHRAAHRWPWLWRFHAIHHSPTRLYFFNAARFHFVDWIALSLIEVAILFAMGADPRVIAIAVVFIQSHGLFQHSNIDVRMGPLNYLLSGPQLHRWHHSRLIRESDTNFGNNVIVWDLLFGTFYLPRDRQVGVLGLLNPDFPQTFLGQLKAAFAPRPLDKPADYHGREAQYEAAIEAENATLG